MKAPILLLVALTAGGSTTGRPTPTPRPEAGAPVPVSVGETPPVVVAVGVATTVRLPLTIAAGYRIQANPASNQFLVPLEVRLDTADGLLFGKPVYPSPRPYRLEGSDEQLDTYQGDLEIVVPMTATGPGAAGPHAVEGTVRYQACTSRTCLFPSSVPITFVVEVVASARPARE